MMLCAWIRRRRRSWHIKTAAYAHFNHVWGDFIFNFFK